MAQQRRLPRLFPEQELTFTRPLAPNLLPRPRPRPRPRPPRVGLSQRAKKQRAELLKSPLDQKRRCKVFLGAASPSGRWEGIFSVGTIARSHATKDTRQAAGRKYQSKYFWNPVYRRAFVLFSLSLLLLFPASTQADVALALFRAAASVASGNLGFSALLSAHSEVSV